MDQKRVGFRDIVQTLYYREIVQNDENLKIINSYHSSKFSTWDEFLRIEKSEIGAILKVCESELDCEPLGQDDLGLRQGGFPIDVIAWEGDEERNVLTATKIDTSNT